MESLKRIVDYEVSLMGGAPFREYIFLFHVGNNFGGGGMEHMNCTAISADVPAQLPSYSAHEFFHAWNVKRIRPQSLEPVDYTKEMWTRSLWFAEGVTNTYGAYTLVRTGLWSTQQFYANLADEIRELQSRPAHRWQSVEQSSLDAWYEKYPLYTRPEESISYYNKGQIVGVLLDILIRDRTDNRASLDDVLRALNEEYAKAGRFYNESEGLRAVMEEVIRKKAPAADADLSDFFRRYISGTDEIPYSDFLARAGWSHSRYEPAPRRAGFLRHSRQRRLAEHCIRGSGKRRERCGLERRRRPDRAEWRSISARAGALAARPSARGTRYRESPAGRGRKGFFISARAANRRGLPDHGNRVPHGKAAAHSRRHSARRNHSLK